MLALVVAGIAKAMRFQEPKPYLKQIPLVIKSDMEKNGFLGRGGVIILGSVGGSFFFDRLIPVTLLDYKLSFDSAQERERLLKSFDALNLPALLLRQPVMYIVTTSHDDGKVIAEWFSERYQLPFALCYEFKRPKDGTRTQAFRVVSPYASGKLPTAVRDSIYQTANLLYNPDFRIRGTRTLREPHRADAPDSGDDVSEALAIPAGWRVKPSSRTPKLSPDMIQYTANGTLRLQCAQVLSLYQSENDYPGGKRYQVFARVRVPKTTYFFLDASRQSGAGFKQIQRVVSRTLAPGDHEIHALLDLSSWRGNWIFEFGIVNGELEVEKLSLVDEKVFRDRAENHDF